LATRSNIGIEYPDGTIHFVYCHWDGYLSNNGEILYNNYTTAEQVEALVALGSISSLDSTPSSTQDYHSWRGEEIAIDTTTERDNVKQEEYAYVFSVKENMWYAKGHGFDWMPLGQALEQDL
jgi:hypothetical protein